MILALLIFHILVTLLMIGVILLQKGEDISVESARAGSARGSSDFLGRVTTVAAIFFFGDCLLMALLVRYESQISASQKKMLTPAGSKDPKDRDTILKPERP